MTDLKAEAEAAAKDAKHGMENAVAAKPWRMIAVVAGLMVLLVAVLALA